VRQLSLLSIPVLLLIRQSSLFHTNVRTTSSSQNKSQDSKPKPHCSIKVPQQQLDKKESGNSNRSLHILSQTTYQSHHNPNAALCQQSKLTSTENAKRWKDSAQKNKSKIKVKRIIASSSFICQSPAIYAGPGKTDAYTRSIIPRRKVVYSQQSPVPYLNPMSPKIKEKPIQSPKCAAR